MNILITGSTGLLGSRLASFFYECGHTVILGSRSSHSRSPICGLPVIKLDFISIYSLSLICQNVDVVIHCSGMNASDSISDPHGSFVSNSLFAANLAQAAMTSHVKLFIYFSTAHIYANPLIGQVDESLVPSNLHPYAASKYCAEHMVRSILSISSTKFLCFRLSNAVGAPAIPSSNCWSLLANSICLDSFRNSKITLSSSGQQWRNFISIDSIVHIVQSALSRYHGFPPSLVLNLGDKSMTVNKFARIVSSRAEQIFNINIPIEITSALPTESIPLEFNHDLLDHYFSPVLYPIEHEIDSLLSFCRKYSSHIH